LSFFFWSLHALLRCARACGARKGFFLSSFGGAKAPLFHQKAQNLKNRLAQKALVAAQFGFLG
jgi:hypothetical protein